MLSYRWLFVSAISLAACVEAPADPITAAPLTCASAPIAAWHGDAGRITQDYPDDAEATVVWTRVATEGCVDRYQPSGNVRYRYAVPGAVCDQEMTPADHPIAATDGWLEIDRSTAPPTYRGHAATAWSVTWTCHLETGDETQTFDGGGTWFDAGGAVDDGVAGTRTVDDGRQCGRGQTSQPCEYTWAFDAAP